MLIALYSDIHGNMPAFQACLTAAETLGVSRHVVLGDLVGYGPDPATVVERVAAMAEQGAIVLRGNHDEAALGSNTGMNPTAQRAMDWTRGQLQDAHRTFLSTCPMQVTEAGVLYVHADASAPAKWNYVTDSETAATSLNATFERVTFCGHVHVPALYCTSQPGRIVAHRPVTGITNPLLMSRKWLAVLGAVGQPRDGNPAASFATYDTDSSELTYRRAAYDVAAVADKVLAAGLPESLAERLLRGR